MSTNYMVGRIITDGKRVCYSRYRVYLPLTYDMMMGMGGSKGKKKNKIHSNEAEVMIPQHFR